MNGTIQKKKMIYLGAAIVMVVVASFLVYWFALRNVNHFPEFDGVYDNGEPISIISVSPSDLSGVAQDEPLIIQWNRPVTADAADAITISPSVKGHWTAIGDQLIFEPQRWKSGTYYTVSIEEGTEIPGSGSFVQKSTAFSFETQDSALRIPSTSGLFLNSRQYFFGEEEDIAIPVSFNDSTGAVPEVSLELWSCEDNDRFIETFLPLFSLPQWANITSGHFEAETSGLKRVNDIGCRLEDGELRFENPGNGQYLVRLTVGGIRRDVALTVGSLNHCFYYDGRTLLYADANGTSSTVTWGNLSADTDENGCVLLRQEEFSYDDCLLDPNKNVVQISNGSETQTIFLPMTKEFDRYTGEITASSHQIEQGDNLRLFGYLIPTLTLDSLPEEVTVSLENENGVVESAVVALDEQGCFSVEWENLSLPKGQWNAIVSVGDEVVTSCNFSVTDKNANEPYLIAEVGSSSYENGDEISFTVHAYDEKERPIEGLTITASGDVGKRITDENGEAIFYFHAMDSNILPVLDQRVVFTATLDHGVVLETECRYSIANSEIETTASPNKAEQTDDNVKVLYGSIQEGALVTSSEADSAYDFMMTLEEDSLEIAPENMVQPNPDFPQELTATAGSVLEFSPNDDGVTYFAALYEGNPAGSSLGQGISSSFGDALGMNAFALDMISSGDATFSLNVPSDSGSYFVRLYGVIPSQGGIYWDIPVTITDGVRLWNASEANISSDDDVSLVFRTRGEADRFTLTLADGITVEGDVAETFTVSLGNLAEGNYHGIITLQQDNREIFNQEVSFSVGREEPLLRVSGEKTEKDKVWQSYKVSDDMRDYVTKLFQLNLIHGDQILQIMARNDFYSALGEDAGSFITYCNNDLLSYQNNDGSFGRLPGLDGDMLLSALVAENEYAEFHRDALLQYAKARSGYDTDLEVLALCYWTMSSLGEPPLDDMKALLHEDDLSDLAALYLAKAFLAAGEVAISEDIYHELSNSLNRDGDSAYFPDNDGQRAIMKTLFMLDLSLSFEGKDQDRQSYLNHLMNVEMTTQTNRYLLSRCLLQLLDVEQISLADDGNLFLLEDTPETEEILTASFQIGDRNIAKCDAGDTVTLEIQWEGLYRENNLYLVYFVPNDGVEVIANERTSLGHGYATIITEGSSAQVQFRAGKASEGVMKEVYVYDLTAGVLLGKTDGKGLVVEE